MLFFKKKFFPIKTTIFVHKENSYYTMNHTVEDLSLFNALRQGDGNSFDHLFRRYYPMLCAYAHRLVSLEDAEEIVQEVMLWLWENRGDLIIESSLNQYLFKMTYRRVLNHFTQCRLCPLIKGSFRLGFHLFPRQVVQDPPISHFEQILIQ